MAAQEIELIVEKPLMYGLGIDVHVVDGVFAQLRANTGSGGRATGGGERGDAVGGAGLHQQRAADTRREPDRPIERHLERRARAHLVAPARARDLGVGLLRAVHREDRARARLSDHRH